MAGRDLIKPIKEPRTIARSLAIGNPADGFYAIQTMKRSGGTAAAPTDDEIVAAMRLLAETEGIFTETAGGVTLGAAQRLIQQGVIGRDESLLLCITGQGSRPPTRSSPSFPGHRSSGPASPTWPPSPERKPTMATVRIPTPLRKLTEGREEVAAMPAPPSAR